MSEATVPRQLIDAYRAFSEKELRQFIEVGSITDAEFESIMEAKDPKYAEKKKAERQAKLEAELKETIENRLHGKQKASKPIDPEFYLLPKSSERNRLVRKCLVDLKRPIFLLGPTGTGKSSTLKAIAKEEGKILLRFNLTAETTVDDFVGNMQKVGDDIKFVDGILPMAMKKGHWLLIDEVDFGLPEVLAIIQAVLEGEPLVITKNGGEIVVPEDGFRIAVTGNTIGRGDDSALYAGTNILNEAFLRRFGLVMHFDYLPPTEEIEIVHKRTGAAKEICEDLVSIATLAREAFKNGQIFTTFCIRRLLAMAELIATGESMHTALTHCLYSTVTEEDKVLLEEMVNRVVGDGSSK